nr:MAG TPA: hypothetical protein [Caudoviricetes sp.]
MKVAKLILSAKNGHGIGVPYSSGDQSPKGVFLWLIAREFQNGTPF